MDLKGKTLAALSTVSIVAMLFWRPDVREN